MKTFSARCRIFVLIPYIAYDPVSAVGTSTPTATLNELPTLITPAPEPPHERLRKRETISGCNYLEGWSILGNTHVPPNPWCYVPSSMSFFTKEKEVVATCIASGVDSDMLDITSTCLDYQNQGYSQTQNGTRYCTQIAPYCAKWLWLDGSSTWSNFGCANKTSFTFVQTKTGPGPPSITSSGTSKSAFPTVTTTGTTGITHAPPSTAETPGPSSSPTATSLAAVIGGTLGGIGILVMLAIAIYIRLARRRSKNKANDQFGTTHGRMGSGMEDGKSLEWLCLSSKTKPTDQYWKSYTLGAAKGVSKVCRTSDREKKIPPVEKVVEEEVDTWFDVENFTQHERATIEKSEGSKSSDVEEEHFKLDIKILDSQSNFKSATALLDTQCQVGNWISLHLVQRLDMVPSISKNFTTPDIYEASGNSVSAIGIIELEWKRGAQGNRVHQTQFFVYSTSGEVDVIFGVQYIVKESLLEVRKNALIPLLVHDKKAKQDSKAALALAKEKQRQDKEALEARRAASQSATQAQSQGQYQQHPDHHQG